MLVLGLVSPYCPDPVHPRADGRIGYDDHFVVTGFEFRREDVNLLDLAIELEGRSIIVIQWSSFIGCKVEPTFTFTCPFSAFSI